MLLLSDGCIGEVIARSKRCSTGVPKTVPHKHSKDQTLYIFDLEIAQDRGLKFYQTDSFAITLSSTTPTEALVKVLHSNRNDSETEILFDNRPPQVTKVSRTYYWNRKRPSSAVCWISLERPDAIICGTSTGKPAA